MDAHDYLISLIPQPQEVQAFTDATSDANGGWTFDGELGWVHSETSLADGVDGSKTYYRYESDGARKVVNFPDEPCRIHTYGNSFTHCDQVSDGETWQEYLAAHFQEPLRNYGVGGYSVYQAYLRMLRVENEMPADYIILNIWSDDHYRNLDAWRSIRFGRRTRCGYPLPYLRVSVEQDQCEQVQNIFETANDVLQLCDEEFVINTFKDDRVLQSLITGGTKLRGGRALHIENAGGSPLYKAPKPPFRQLSPDPFFKPQQYTEAALYATRNVVDWTEQFANQTGKKLLVLLSFSEDRIAAHLRDEPRFDQSFLDWIQTRSCPVLDMRDAFAADFAHSNLDPQQYLGRYYNGHHSPAGNFFTAWAIKDALVQWFDPKPFPYQGGEGRRQV